MDDMRLNQLLKTFPVWVAFLVAAGIAASSFAKTITIKGFSGETGDTIELEDGASVDLAVNEDGIVLTLPEVDVRVRCLGDATAEGFCLLSAASGGSGADSDGDGVPDSSDQCASSGGNTFVNSNGCSSSQLDSDNDGVANSADQCSGTATGASVDANGCSDAQNGGNDDADDDADADGDPVVNDGTYCSGASSITDCDKSDNLDVFWEDSTEVRYTIRAGKILSLPFTVRAQDGATYDDGFIQLTTNQSPPPASGLEFRMWYSDTAAGTPLTTGKCDVRLARARSVEYWTQDPNRERRYRCYLGTAERVLHLNMEVVNADRSERLDQNYVFDLRAGA